MAAAAVASSCPPLEDLAGVQSLVKGIRAEMMVAMLEGLQGTAAACTEICLRRLEAQRRELQHGCRAEETPSTASPVGTEAAPSSSGRTTECFLMDADDGGAVSSRAPAEQAQAAESRRGAPEPGASGAGDERPAAAADDLDAWYAEVSPGRADLGADGASSRLDRDARAVPEPDGAAEGAPAPPEAAPAAEPEPDGVAEIAPESTAAAEERRPEPCLRAEPPPASEVGGRAEEAELNAPPEPSPDAALGVGSFEELAELMENAPLEQAEPAAPGAGAAAPPEPVGGAPPDADAAAAQGPFLEEAAGSGAFEALADALEDGGPEQAEPAATSAGAVPPEPVEGARLDADPTAAREPSVEDAAGSGAFEALADALEDGGPEQALPEDAPEEDDLDFAARWGFPVRAAAADSPAPDGADGAGGAEPAVAEPAAVPPPVAESVGGAELAGAEPAADPPPDAESVGGAELAAAEPAAPPSSDAESAGFAEEGPGAPSGEAALGDDGAEAWPPEDALWQCVPCQACGGGAEGGALPGGLLTQCPASGGGKPPDGPSPQSQGGSAESGNGDEELGGSHEPGAGGGPGEGPGGEGSGDAPAGGGASVEAQASELVSHEPVMDVIVPDGCTYQGEKIPEGCTVGQWKSSLEAGEGGAKVLYARKLVCHADRQKRKLLSDDSVLPLRPEVVAVSGPGAVMQMLELALRKRLGTPLPPPIVAAEGRAFACATASCRFMVHSDPACGNYCCNMCLEADGRGHSEDCEMRQAPRHAPKGKAQAKYRAMSLTTDDLLKKEATFKPVTGEAKRSTYEIVKARGNYLGPYCDGETMSGDDVRKRLSLHNSEHGWTLDYNLNFYAELLYEGVFPMGFELPGGEKGPIQAILFCYDPKVSVWDFHETHVSRQVRKHAKSYSMTIDKAYDDVILGCVRQHGEAWLYRGYRWMLRKLFKEGYKGTKMKFGVHSFELWDEKNQLVAGDLGCTIGGIYMSFSGFRVKDTKSCGEVQMVLTAGLLSKMGFDWMDLGQVLKYKERMGAKVITRKEYYARLRRDRDRSTELLHDRVSGQELLAVTLQAVADGPKPMPTGEHDEFVVVFNKVAMRERPSLEARILGVWHKDAELEGTPHDVGGLPWLQVEEGWVLMDGKTLGVGKLVAPRHSKVDYGKALADAGLEDKDQPGEAAEEAPPAPAEPAGEDQEPPAAAEGQEKEAKDKDGEKKEKEGEKKEKEEKKQAKDPKKGSETEEQKRKKKAEKEAATRKQAAERVARLEAKEEKAAKYRQEEEEAVERALERRRNPELYKPKSLKEKKKWRREEELLQKREEAERAKQRAAEEEAARLQAIEDMKKKRAEEVEEKKKKAEEQAALKKIADQEAAKKKAEDEAIVQAMILAVTEGATPLPNQPKTLPKAKLKALAAKCVPTMEDQDLEDDGRLWVVTGGEGKGGIMVRAAESINSRQLPSRLLTGSTVEELEIAGNRLHYKRIRGDGPDWGWVSIMLSGKLLVEPFPT